MHCDDERCLLNLHVLGALSHNDKLMTQEDVFSIYVPSATRGAWRMWYGESRRQNVDRVRQVVHQATEFVTRTMGDTWLLLENQEDRNVQQRAKLSVLHYTRMIDALSKARGGLQNFTQTYREDAALASQIKLIMREIDDYLSVTSSRASETRSRVCVDDAGCALTLS